ncbi:MAG: ABC transporter permease subunit [Ectobacillus sp.]
MNRSVVWAIAYKDIKAITSNSQIWLGFVLTPLIFCVIMPLALILAARFADMQPNELTAFVTNTINQLPRGDIRAKIESFPTLNHQMIFLAVNYLLGSLFLLIPCLNSMMIAANSFVGEKERRTLESLLFAPVTVSELFVAKVLAAFLPAMAISLASFLLFGIVVTIATADMFGQLIFPNANWLILIFWLCPVISLLTILVNVLVSARVKGFQEAQQLGGIVVIPIIGLFVAQTTGFLVLNPLLLLLIGFVLLIVNGFLLKKITAYNSRNVLFEKQI